MTRPTDTEIAALLRELAGYPEEEANMALARDDLLFVKEHQSLADRALAMAEKLEGKS